MQELFAITGRCYKRAIKAARRKNFINAFSLYVDAFFPRLCTCHSSEKEFKCFYRWQLANYLYEKDNYYVALAEGDMVSDLILDAYNDFLESMKKSRFKISQEGRINLLSGVKVDFPLKKCFDSP